jgi:hypothetical protein
VDQSHRIHNHLGRDVFRSYRFLPSSMDLTRTSRIVIHLYSPRYSINQKRRQRPASHIGRSGCLVLEQIEFVRALIRRFVFPCPILTYHHPPKSRVAHPRPRVREAPPRRLVASPVTPRGKVLDERKIYELLISGIRMNNGRVISNERYLNVLRCSYEKARPVHG